jgi:hypothetical protein
MNAMDEEMLRRAWEGAEGECGGLLGLLLLLGCTWLPSRQVSAFRLDEETIR